MKLAPAREESAFCSKPGSLPPLGERPFMPISGQVSMVIWRRGGKSVFTRSTSGGGGCAPAGAFSNSENGMSRNSLHQKEGHVTIANERRRSPV